MDPDYTDSDHKWKLLDLLNSKHREQQAANHAARLAWLQACALEAEKLRWKPNQFDANFLKALGISTE